MKDRIFYENRCRQDKITILLALLFYARRAIKFCLAIVSNTEKLQKTGPQIFCINSFETTSFKLTKSEELCNESWKFEED